jgi:hypothetical protein
MGSTVTLASLTRLPAEKNTSEPDVDRCGVGV